MSNFLAVYKCRLCGEIFGCSGPFYGSCAEDMANNVFIEASLNKVNVRHPSGVPKVTPLLGAHCCSVEGKKQVGIADFVGFISEEG